MGHLCLPISTSAALALNFTETRALVNGLSAQAIEIMRVPKIKVFAERKTSVFPEKHGLKKTNMFQHSAVDVSPDIHAQRSEEPGMAPAQASKQTNPKPWMEYKSELDECKANWLKVKQPHNAARVKNRREHPKRKVTGKLETDVPFCIRIRIRTCCHMYPLLFPQLCFLPHFPWVTAWVLFRLVRQ